jgi:hypothetical protein
MRRIAFAFLLVALLATVVTAQGRWQLLGQRNVSDRADHDTIAVTKAKGDFKSIRLEVRRHPIDFHRVVIHYANGGEQVVELRSTIPANGESRIIDLEGRDRIIRRIDLWYDAKSVGKGGRAAVRVLGRD